MNPDPKSIAIRTREIREAVTKAVLDGDPYVTLAHQRRIAEKIGCHYNSVRKALQRMGLVGRAARGLGPDPRTVRAQMQRALRFSKEPIDLTSFRVDPPGERTVADIREEQKRDSGAAQTQPDINLEEGRKQVEIALLDARDPVQRLELLNRLATNAKGDVPYAVQSAALTKIADEAKTAGEGFGPPPPSTDEEETQRVFDVLRSALPHCANAAWEKLQLWREEEIVREAILKATPAPELKSTSTEPVVTFKTEEACTQSLYAPETDASSGLAPDSEMPSPRQEPEFEGASGPTNASPLEIRTPMIAQSSPRRDGPAPSSTESGSSPNDENQAPKTPPADESGGDAAGGGGVG